MLLPTGFLLTVLGCHAPTAWIHRQILASPIVAAFRMLHCDLTGFSKTDRGTPIVFFSSKNWVEAEIAHTCTIEEVIAEGINLFRGF